MTIAQLRVEVGRLIDAGDEKALETFVLEHFSELPEDVQGKILLGFVKETLEKNEADEKITQMRAQAIQALDTLAEMKSELEKKD